MKNRTILAALALAFTLGAALAQQPAMEPVGGVDARTYNPQLAAERRELLRILGRTKICMFDATTAARHELGRQRPRSPEAAERTVKMFVKDMCSGAIRPYLINTARWSAADAEDFVDELVEREVAASTSWGQQ